MHLINSTSMGDLQARIGPKVTKLYPNLTWKRPGGVPPSPSKDTLKSSQTQAHQSDEKDAASSDGHASSTFSSPSKSSYQSTSSLPRSRTSRKLSLLSRMGLSSGASQDTHHASEGKEAAGTTPPSLLSRVGTTEDKTPQPSTPSSLVCLFFAFCNASSFLLFASFPI